LELRVKSRSCEGKTETRFSDNKYTLVINTSVFSAATFTLNFNTSFNFDRSESEKNFSVL